MTTLRKIFNKTDRDGNPLKYTFYCTNLENVTDQIMTIDSCSNITLITPSNNFVTINSRLGIGIDPSSAYSFHVLGNTCISGNVISNNINILETNSRDIKIDISAIKTDISAIKTDISGLKIGIRGFNADISASERKITDLSLNLFNLSIRYNEISSNYYNLTNSFNDLSRSHYNLKSSVTSLSNELYLKFDSINYSTKTGFYGKIFVYNNSFSDISYRFIDISYRFYWYIEPIGFIEPIKNQPLGRLKQTNWFSISGQPAAYEISELYRLDSVTSYLHLHTKASNNNIFNPLFKPYVTTFNNKIVDICNVFLNNNSEHKMTFDLSNIDNINDGEIIIRYDVLYAVIPNAPTNVIASDPSNGRVTLNWTAPYSGGATITEYNVTSNPSTLILTVYSTSTIFQGLTNGTSYTFNVRARNNRGNSLPGTSNSITPSTIPSIPTNIVASVLINGNVSLTWTAPYNGGATIIEYSAYYIASNSSIVSLITTNGNETSIIFDRNNSPGILTNRTPYIFYVIASNISGNSLPGSSNTVTIFDNPDPPRNVIASVVGEGTIELNWDLPDDDGGSAIINYGVQRVIVVSEELEEYIIDGSSIIISQRTLIINNLLLDTSYGFAVVAYNTNRVSNFTLSNTIKLFTNPNPPRNVVATRSGETNIELNWDLPDFDGGSAIINYKVFRLINISGDFNTSGFILDSSFITISQNNLIYNLVLFNVYAFVVEANNALFASSPAASNIIALADPGYVGTLNIVVLNLSGGYQDVILRITTENPLGGDINYVYNNTLNNDTMSFDISLDYVINYLYIATEMNSESDYIINTQLTGFDITSPAIINYSSMNLGEITYKRYTIPNSLSSTDINYNIYLTQGYYGTLNIAIPQTDVSNYADFFVSIITNNVENSVYNLTLDSSNTYGPINLDYSYSYLYIYIESRYPFNNETSGFEADDQPITHDSSANINGTNYERYIIPVTLANSIIKYNIYVSGLHPDTPDTPTNVIASDPNNSAVTLSWTAPYDRGYPIIDYSVTSNPYTTSLTVESVNVNTSTVFQGLTNGTTYTFYVRARNSNGNSLPGTSNTIIPFIRPGPPSNVVAIRTGETSIGLTWDSPEFDGGSAIINYTVVRLVNISIDISLGGFIFDSSNIISQNNLTINNLVLLNTYVFIVIANNANGASEGAASNFIRLIDPGYVGTLNVLVTNLTDGYEDVILRITTDNPQNGDLVYIYDGALLTTILTFDLSLDYVTNYLYIATETISGSDYIINTQLTGFDITSPAIINYSSVNVGEVIYKRYTIPNSLSSTDISYVIYLTQGYYGTLNITVIPQDLGLFTRYSDISFIIIANSTSNNPLFNSVLNTEITSISINIDYSTNYLYIYKIANNYIINNETSGFEDISIVSVSNEQIGTNLYTPYIIPVSLANSIISYNIYITRTGFYGTLSISNETLSGNNSRFIQVKLAYNNVDITSYITISGNSQQTLTIPIEERLPDISSILQLKYIFEDGVNDLGDTSSSIVGFNLINQTNNPLQSENTSEVEIFSDFINLGELKLTTQPITYSGFYGTFIINNKRPINRDPQFVQVKLAYNDVDITSYITISGDRQETLTITENARLPNPNSILQLKFIFEDDVINYNISDISGFSLISYSNNLLQSENTLRMLINNGYIDDGILTITIEPFNNKGSFEITNDGSMGQILYSVFYVSPPTYDQLVYLYEDLPVNQGETGLFAYTLPTNLAMGGLLFRIKTTNANISNFTIGTNPKNGLYDAYILNDNTVSFNINIVKYNFLQITIVPSPSN
uniref:Fibronectin type-III domain-containing protein n=1 Tax=viral metagenome TaxID=1070528 RepID=A0A6C0DVU4_9ZZZZ